MKKKFLAIIICAALASGLSACTTGENRSANGNSSTPIGGSSSSEKANSSTVSTPEVGNSTPGETSSEPATESNIKIVSHELGKDYQGKDALIIEFEWTNTDEKEANFMTSFNTKFFQNGIECESAIGVDGVDTLKQMNDIQPGITYKVKKAFVLQDKSAVNIVVKDLFGSTTLINEKIDLGGGESTSAPNGNIAETSVKIKDHKLSKDYQGADVLVVNYEFYNGESEAKGFTFTFSDKAFQNGVECDSTVIGCKDVDTQAGLNDVQPGYSYIVSVGYHITDRSDVQIKVTDLFGTRKFLDETVKLS